MHSDILLSISSLGRSVCNKLCNVAVLVLWSRVLGMASTDAFFGFLVIGCVVVAPFCLSQELRLWLSPDFSLALGRLHSVHINNN